MKHLNMENSPDIEKPSEIVEFLYKYAMSAIENGLIPDRLIRMGIHHLIKARYKEVSRIIPSQKSTLKQRFIDELKKQAIAVKTDIANEQHYELPSAFFELILGAHLKYSCGYWPASVQNLSEAEQASLDQTCNRAQLKDSMELLELGCGWGSLTLWMAEHFPNSRITAVSNSANQKQYIEKQIAHKGIRNVCVITADMNHFVTNQKFDRVLSIEMFEHMRNWPKLLQRVGNWLHPNGKLFLHIFCHKDMPYLFTEEGEHNWMGKYFFSGGMMPSADLPLYLQQNLHLENHWAINGTHYQKTAQAWLQNMTKNETAIKQIFKGVYGEAGTKLWWQRWKLFFMACEELFGFQEGEQWWVSHYLLKNR